MTEQLAVRDRTSSPDATRRKEAVQPNEVHRLLGDAFQASQKNKIHQWIHSSEEWGKAFASNYVGQSSDGKSIYVGQRYIPGEGVVYGLLDAKDKTGRLREKLEEGERIYHTVDEVAELLGDEAEKHAARILWRLARDKNALPEEIIRRADEMGLASITPHKKDGSAVVFVPDVQSGKMIRFFTEKPMPATDQAREALIRNVKAMIADHGTQKRIESGTKRKFADDAIAVDITRENGELSVGSSDVLVGIDVAKDRYNTVPVEFQSTVDGVEIAVHPKYSFPSDWTPAEREAAKGKPIRLIGPGWSMGGMSKTAGELAQEAANLTRQPVLALDTFAYQERDDLESLLREAGSIAEFFKHERIEKVEFVGHSQGARKMLELARILQQRREAAKSALESATTAEQRSEAAEELAAIPEILGVKSINIRGLADQTPWHLVTEFGLDAMGRTTKKAIQERFRRHREPGESDIDWSNSKAMLKRALKAGTSILGGVRRTWRELGSIKATKTRIVHDIQEMAAAAPDSDYRNRLREINDIPLEFIFSENDKVSDIEAVIPGYQDMTPQQRSEYMQKEYFPGVPAEKITVTIYKKFGGLHGGPAVFGPNDIFGPDVVDTYKTSVEPVVAASEV